jgi:hypothetical protein
MGKRPRTAVKNETITDREKLIEALRFAALALKDDKNTGFVSFRGGWLFAENETFTLGIPVKVDLDLCPHAEMLSAALIQCGDHFQVTQTSPNTLAIRSGAFRAVVPALEKDEIRPLIADYPCANLTDAITESFTACLPFMGKGDRIINKAMLLQAGSTCATNGHIALEYWHGIDLPGPLNIPRKTIESVIKIGKPLIQFGFSDASVTFVFDDQSFLKTRLIGGQWPDLSGLFAKVTAPFKVVWPQFFVGVKAISAFTQNDTIVFHDNHIATHTSLDLGANYHINGLPTGYCFSAVCLKMIEPFVKQISIASPREPLAFIGDKSRGLLMGKTP